MAMSWNEATVELLKKLWELGQSASKIGAELGCSRNAVIGKIHRIMGMNANRKPRERKIRPSAEAQQRPLSRITIFPKNKNVLCASSPASTTGAADTRAKDMTDMKQAPPMRHLTIMELDKDGTRSCRWPIGDSNFRYCGNEAMPGLPYCEHHTRMAYAHNAQRVRAA